MEKVLNNLGVKFISNEGDTKFYGPSTNILIKDCLGREWQCVTIQLDFNMPKLFELEYIAENNEKRTPVMLYRTIFGSLERFIEVLIEQVAGVFPTWLTQTQVIVIPISDGQNEYAKEITVTLGQYDIRVKLDDSNESLNKRIRNAEILRIPYIIVIRANEVANKTISL